MELDLKLNDLATKALVEVTSKGKTTVTTMLLDTVGNFITKTTMRPEHAVLMRNCVLADGTYETNLVGSIFKVRLYHEEGNQHRRAQSKKHTKS